MTILITVIIAGMAVAAILFAYTGKMKQEISELNSYLKRVLSGHDVPDIRDQKEGELSILKNNIYKTTSTLRHQKELIREEKLRLADAMADISHQLKTPLTSMMVMNDLLTCEEDPEKRREFLNTQSHELNRMNWLIQTLLKLSKIDAGSIEMKKEEVNASDLIYSALKPFEIMMELKDIKQEISPGKGVFECDRNWTMEALRNIIKNCIEHMEDSGTLSVETKDTTIFREISISDTGSGIPEEEIPHIFERFYKGKDSGKDGVGIGLALSKSIIERQHGEILVHSTVGEGTRFDVRLYKTVI